MKLKITVHGVAYEVDVEVLDPGKGFPAHSNGVGLSKKVTHSTAENSKSPSQPIGSDINQAPSQSTGEKESVASPIAGTIMEIKRKPGDEVSKGQELIVIEAMKMKTAIAAPTSGIVKTIPIAVGDTVRESQILVELE